MKPCTCPEHHHRKRLVLTGGPGAGKTAVLALVRESLCEHVKLLPEAASVVFGGGFPRNEHAGCREAAQRAIFYVQHELENAADSWNPAIVLCDRGTIDGAAYCESAEALFSSVGTTVEEQLKRYDAVIHLRTPSVDTGYNHENPLRTESPEVAAALDRKIAAVWARHPRVLVVENQPDFLSKARIALDFLSREVPECCRGHFSVR
jgi:predicted ATPase